MYQLGQSRLLQLLRNKRRLVLRMHLLHSLLLGHLKSLLINLDHVVIFLLFKYEFLVEDFVDIDDGLLYFREHLLKLVLEARDDFLIHRLLELVLYDSSNRCIIGP